MKNSGILMQGASRLPNSTVYVVEPGYLGECGHSGSSVLLFVDYVSFTSILLLFYFKIEVTVPP